MNTVPLIENDVIETLNGKKNSPYKNIGDAYFDEYDNCEIKITGCPNNVSHFNQIRPHSNCNYILIDYSNQHAYFITQEQMHKEIYEHKIASPSHGKLENQKTEDIREWSIHLRYGVKNPREKAQLTFKRFASYRNKDIEKKIFG